LFLGKSTKTAATRAALNHLSAGASPDPIRGAYSAPSDPLAVFRGLLRRERREREKRGRDRREGEGVRP